MEIIKTLFGEGEDLEPLQMSCRAVVVFIIALILLRFSGRRSFGMKMPFDYVMTILLGAVLSRAVTGASPFWGTIAASAVLAGMHRLFAWIGIYSDLFGRTVKGDPKVLYENGQLYREHMKHCLITEKDMQEAIRLNGMEDISEAKIITVERGGQISIVKNKEEDT